MPVLGNHPLPLSRRTRLAALPILLGCLAASGWQTRPLSLVGATGTEPLRARLSARLGVSNAQISGVALHVTGRGIDEPLVFSLGSPDSLGRPESYTAELPAGGARVFQGRAYTGDVLTHEGADTLDVQAWGVQVRIDLRKFPHSDSVYTDPARDFRIEMDDAASFGADTDSTTAVPGSKLALSVRVTDRAGVGSLDLLTDDAVPDMPVSWGVDADLIQLSDWVCTTGASSTAEEGECTLRVLVSPAAAAGSRATVFASSGGVADRMVINIE